MLAVTMLPSAVTPNGVQLARLDLLQRLTKAVSGFKFSRDRCLYCDSTTANFEWDHFPIPDRRGGHELVRACRHCHNLKDRVSQGIFDDCLASIEDEALNAVVFSVEEIAFVFGKASIIDPFAAEYMIDDIRDFPPQVRLAIARNLAYQFDELAAACS